jgi:hypothetical protein
MIEWRDKGGERREKEEKEGGGRKEGREEGGHDHEEGGHDHEKAECDRSRRVRRMGDSGWWTVESSRYGRER